MNFKILIWLRVIFLIFLCGVLLKSCKKEDRYYNLSTEAKDFLVYNEGDIFKLKNERTGDTITFQITTRSMEFVEDNPPSGHFAWGVSGDTYFEEGHIIFNSDEGCTGEIWVVADFQNKFSVNINFYNCIENFYSTEYEFFGNVEVNGHNYTDAYLFRGNRELYFSKDIGILRIDGYSREILYSLLE